LSQAGHYQELVIVADVIRVLRHPIGTIQAIIVQVTLNERLELAIITNHWPQGICEGARIHAKGRLVNERSNYRRASHYMAPRFIEVVPRRRKAS
jgi:hypothetical protein